MHKFFSSLFNDTFRRFTDFGMLLLLWVMMVFVSCQEGKKLLEPEESDSTRLLATLNREMLNEPLIIEQDSFLEYEFEVTQSGRYRWLLKGTSDSGWIWIEDYVNNSDKRTYDITGKIFFGAAPHTSPQLRSKDGSPMQKGVHRIRIHAGGADVQLHQIDLKLWSPQKETPQVLRQSMTGEDWVLRWSDEFNGMGLPDSSKWSFNAGDWGWGNNELQYYTMADTLNVYQEDGRLVIRALKDEFGRWTSARITTQGKTSFLYGKIEFRAKVPNGRGTWSAGWLLGDLYRDEISWPYCGEIDVLEAVGYEFDKSGLHGINHASCHTRAYYFKQGNQITGQIPVAHMSDSFHTFSIEWYPDVIHAFVDDKLYYSYDKNDNKFEWPFDEAQNIILNLAMGGGWGGAKGLDPSLKMQQLFIDYVRVYEKR